MISAVFTIARGIFWMVAILAAGLIVVNLWERLVVWLFWREK